MYLYGSVNRVPSRMPADHALIKKLAGTYFSTDERMFLADTLGTSFDNLRFTADEAGLLVQRADPEYLAGIARERGTTHLGAGHGILQFYDYALTLDEVMHRMRSLATRIRSIGTTRAPQEVRVLQRDIMSPDGRPWELTDKPIGEKDVDGKDKTLGQRATDDLIYATQTTGGGTTIVGGVSVAIPVTVTKVIRKKTMREKLADELLQLSFPMLNELAAISQGLFKIHFSPRTQLMSVSASPAKKQFCNVFEINRAREAQKDFLDDRKAIPNIWYVLPAPNNPCIVMKNHYFSEFGVDEYDFNGELVLHATTLRHFWDKDLGRISQFPTGGAISYRMPTIARSEFNTSDAQSRQIQTNIDTKDRKEALMDGLEKLYNDARDPTVGSTKESFYDTPSYYPDMVLTDVELRKIYESFRRATVSKNSVTVSIPMHPIWASARLMEACHRSGLWSFLYGFYSKLSQALGAAVPRSLLNIHPGYAASFTKAPLLWPRGVARKATCPSQTAPTFWDGHKPVERSDAIVRDSRGRKVIRPDIVQFGDMSCAATAPVPVMRGAKTGRKRDSKRASGSRSKLSKRRSKNGATMETTRRRKRRSTTRRCN